MYQNLSVYGFYVIFNTTDFIFNVNLTLKVNVNKNIAMLLIITLSLYRKRAKNI